MTFPDRGVGKDLVDRWGAAHGALLALLDGVGATADVYTSAVKLIAKPIRDAGEFMEWLQPHVREDGVWGFCTTHSPDGKQGLALPLSPNAPLELSSQLVFVEMHTWLTAWWLMYAWRARQLATAVAQHYIADDIIAAAACARALVESAAAVWSDSRVLAEAWRAVKTDRSGLTESGAAARCQRMMTALWGIMFGSKFTRSQELKTAFGRFERTNVLGQIDKLSKAYSCSLADDYEWLCNTVHPSIGNAFVFGRLWLHHDTGTHLVAPYSGKALVIKLPDGSIQRNERPVEMAVVRGAGFALEVLTATLDEALRVVDDVGLTTRAPELARDKYWRNIRRPGLYELCPCRSGHKVKWCQHIWGESTAR